MPSGGLNEDSARFQRDDAPTSPTGTTFRLKLDAAGRIVIPAPARAALGVADGDFLIGRVEDGKLLLMSHATAVRKVQSLVRQHVPEYVSLVEGLIAERRLEAERE